MGTASTGAHPAAAAPWPHAVIQSAAASLFAEAAARSALVLAEAGGNETAAQAHVGASSTTANALTQLSSAENISGTTSGAIPVHHGAGRASHAQQSIQQPAMTSGDGSGFSTSNAPSQVKEESWPEGTGNASQPVLPHSAEPELASAAAPAAGSAADAAARTVSEPPADEPVAMANRGVEVTMSMWQIYCDAAQDLLAPGAPPLRGRSMEGLRRVRVTSAADVQVPCTQLSLQYHGSVTRAPPACASRSKLRSVRLFVAEVLHVCMCDMQLSLHWCVDVVHASSGPACDRHSNERGAICC